MNKRTINLLPKEEKKRDVKSVVISVFMVIVIMLFIAVVLLSIFIFDIDSKLSSRLNNYENINIKIQDQVYKLKAYNDFSKDVSEKQDIIENINSNEILWSQIIYDIGRSIPEGANIKTFTAQGVELYLFLKAYEEGEVEEGTQVLAFSIYGDALEYIDVLKLMIELKKIENINQVWIKNITNITVPEMNTEIINFAIDAFWDIDKLVEDIKQKEKPDDENALDSDLEELES